MRLHPHPAGGYLERRRACGALEGAVRAVSEQAVVDVETEAGYEAETEIVADDQNDGEVVVYPLLDGSELVGCLLLRVTSSAATFRVW